MLAGKQVEARLLHPGAEAGRVGKQPVAQIITPLRMKTTAELRKLVDSMAGRELRMAELKAEIAGLKARSTADEPKVAGPSADTSGVIVNGPQGPGGNRETPFP